MVFLPRFEQNSARLFYSKWQNYLISSKIVFVYFARNDIFCIFAAK